MKPTLSVISGFLIMLAFVPYGWAIWRDRNKTPGTAGKTEPAKASWIIWASLDTITLWGMIAKHSTNGQIIGAVSGAWFIVLLALKYGVSGWTRLDKFCLAGAVFGICLMFINPVYSIITSLCVVFLGSFPTFASTWRDPSKENKLAWVIFELSSIVATLAVPKWTFEDAAQPIVFLAVQTIMIYLLFVRKVMTREEMENTLKSVQERIQSIIRETDSYAILVEEMSEKAVDRGSIYERQRYNGRQEQLAHNRWLIGELKDQEKRLQKKLGSV